MKLILLHQKNYAGLNAFNHTVTLIFYLVLVIFLLRGIGIYSLKYVNLVLIVVFFFSIWARCEIIVNVVCSMMCLNFEGRVGFVMLE